MLYPIELLRHIGDRKEMRGARTACMLTGRPAFVMSSVGFLSVGQRQRRTPDAKSGVIRFHADTLLRQQPEEMLDSDGQFT